MTIKTVLEELKTSDKPVARALHTGKGYNVLVMAFKKGMITGEHAAKIPSKLTVLEGRVAYKHTGPLTWELVSSKVDSILGAARRTPPGEAESSGEPNETERSAGEDRAEPPGGRS